MSELVLLTASDCHLCFHARGVLDQLAAEGLLSWREVSADSDEGRRLAGSAPPIRPVLYGHGGQIEAYGRLSERRLRQKLAVASRPGSS